MTRFTFVRHGTTQWIEAGRLHGRTDSVLSEQGIREASAVANFLAGERFDAFYTSPAGRAVQTADAISVKVGLQPVPVRELAELNFGWIEGKPVTKYLDGDDSMRITINRILIFGIAYLSGESFSSASRRYRSFLQFILKQHPNHRVLLVGHSTGYRVIMRQLYQYHGHYWEHDFPIARCGVSEFEVDPQGKLLWACLNQREHLDVLSILHEPTEIIPSEQRIVS